MKRTSHFLGSVCRAARLAVACAIVCMAAPKASAQFADVSVIDVGMTNTLVANATQTANLGNPVQVSPQTSVGLALSFVGAAAVTGNVTLTLARSADGTKWETTPQFTFIVPLNGTNSVVGVTNLPSSVIGSFKWIKVVSAANSAASNNSPTSVVLEVIKKRGNTAI
jgi:hypothetical protein